MISKLILVKAQSEMKKYRRMLDDPMVHQKKILFQILNHNKNTEYGSNYNFASINTIKDFQEQIPLEEYFQKYHYFKRAFEKENVLSQDSVVHWIQTTGTLGTPKILPITQDGLKRYSAGSSRLFFSYLLDKPGNEKTLDGKIFTYIGQSRLDQISGIPLGYISGVSMERMTNPILKKRLIPSMEIINIPEWKERLWQTMMHIVGEDVRAVAGIAPVLLGFLRTMQSTLPMQLDKINDTKIRTKVQNSVFDDSIDFEMLWPNLQYLASTGVMVEIYRPLIKDFLGDISVFEMYAASEGHFAFQMHEDDLGMYLNFDNYFFEFKDPRDPDTILLLDEVKENTPYEMIITNCSGVYRYNMHDTIKFISIDPPKIVVQGRTGNILNIGSEKVSEDQLALVINQVMQSIEKSSVDYILSGTIALPLRHKVYIELAKLPKDIVKDASLLSDIYDELMKKLNTSYDIARGQEALTQPEIHILKKGAFHEISERKAERTGQIAHSKILHIIQPEKLDKLIDEEMIMFSYIPDEESDK